MYIYIYTSLMMEFHLDPPCHPHKKTCGAQDSYVDLAQGRFGPFRAHVAIKIPLWAAPWLFQHGMFHCHRFRRVLYSGFSDFMVFQSVPVVHLNMISPDEFHDMMVVWVSFQHARERWHPSCKLGSLVDSLWDLLCHIFFQVAFPNCFNWLLDQ